MESDENDYGRFHKGSPDIMEKHDAQYQLEEAFREINKLHDKIRWHRDQWLGGDNKCWKDNEELYKLLPEGYTPPDRDTLVELDNCKQYIASCHDPRVKYISPQVRIEELEEQVKYFSGQAHADNMLYHAEHNRVVELEEQVRRLNAEMNTLGRDVHFNWAKQ